MDERTNIAQIPSVMSVSNEEANELCNGSLTLKIQQVSLDTEPADSSNDQNRIGQTRIPSNIQSPGTRRLPSNDTTLKLAASFHDDESQKSSNDLCNDRKPEKPVSPYHVLSKGDEQELKEILQNVQNILNECTSQNLDISLSQMKALNIDTPEKLLKCVDVIFEEAVNKPRSCVLLAKMCRELSNCPHLKNLELDDVEGKWNIPPQYTTVSFRMLLLKKCQEDFEKASIDNNETCTPNMTTGEKSRELLEEDFCKNELDRDRMLGNIRFIGELFKLRMIDETIIHNELIVILLRFKRGEVELECLCILLTIVGKILDRKKARPRIDQYFNQIQKIIAKRKVSQHIKIALQSLIDLRDNNWLPINGEGNYNNQMIGDTMQEKLDNQLHQKQYQPKKFNRKSKSYKAQNNVSSDQFNYERVS